MRPKRLRSKKVRKPPQSETAKEIPEDPETQLSPGYLWQIYSLQSRSLVAGGTNNISLGDSARSHFTVCKHTYYWRYLGRNSLFCYIRFTSAFAIGPIRLALSSSDLNFSFVMGHPWARQIRLICS
jgi:hypothetical protein